MINKSTLMIGLALSAMIQGNAAAQEAQASPEEAGRRPLATGSSETPLSEIVVTATRREERLQDVPLAVTALGAETLRARGINQVGDLSGGRVPGLAVSPLFGAASSLVFYIRGFGPADASQGTSDMPVAFYIDGVNFPRAQGAGIDLVDPERIEVLRGPQGQLFGRNAHSGAVQVISRRPSGVFGGDFTFTAGNFNTWGAKGRIDLPEIAGFRVQLSGNWRKHDGYIKNPFNPNYTNVTLALDPLSHTKYVNKNFNGDWDQLDTYGGRIAVTRDFGDLNVFYSYDRSRSEDDRGYGVLARSDQPNTIFSGFLPVSPNLIFSNFSGPGGSQVTFVQPTQGSEYPKSAAYAFPRIPYINKSSGHVLNLTYLLSDQLTLRAITGARTVSREGGSVLSATTSTFFAGGPEYLHSNMFSQEVQAIYVGQNLNITTGAVYFKEDVIDERASLLAYNCISPVVVASASCVPGSSQATTAPHDITGFKRSLSNTRAYGLYAQGTLKLGPVELTAGARYSNDTKKGARVIDRNLGINYDLGLNPVRRNRFHTSRVDPAFTIKYNFSDAINIYARYAQGYRDGGSSVRSVVFSSFDEDEIKSWEVGLKSQFLDHRITLNVAAFRNTIDGQQLTIQTGLPNPAITDSINSPQKRVIKGIEVEIAATPVNGLTISGSYTYLKSSNILLGYNISTLVPFASNATFTPQTGLIPSPAEAAAHPNSQLLFIGPLGTPKHAGSVNVDYVAPLGSAELALHLDWIASSKFNAASPEIAMTLISPTGVATPVTAYNGGASTNRFNARLAYRNIRLTGGSTGEIAFWMKNVFNHVDAAYSNAGAGINSPTNLQPPRTFGADFRVRW